MNEMLGRLIPKYAEVKEKVEGVSGGALGQTKLI